MSPINTELIVCILSNRQVKLNIDNKIQLYDNSIIIEKMKIANMYFQTGGKMNEIHIRQKEKRLKSY